MRRWRGNCPYCFLSAACLLGFKLDAKPSVPGKPPTCWAAQSLHAEKEEDARQRVVQGPGGDHLVGRGGKRTLGLRLQGLSRGFVRPPRARDTQGRPPARARPQPPSGLTVTCSSKIPAGVAMEQARATMHPDPDHGANLTGDGAAVLASPRSHPSMSLCTVPLTYGTPDPQDLVDTEGRCTQGTRALTPHAVHTSHTHTPPRPHTTHSTWHATTPHTLHTQTHTPYTLHTRSTQTTYHTFYTCTPQPPIHTYTPHTGTHCSHATQTTCIPHIHYTHTPQSP